MNIIVADPFNDNHVKMFNDFEELNNPNKPMTKYMESIRNTCDRKKYNKIVNNNNEFNTIIFTMDENNIRDYCLLKGEKDRKVCELFFASLKENKHRSIMDKATKYALDVLGMEQLFVSITAKEGKLYNQLINNGYEDIGEVNGKITLLKEKEDEIEIGKIM